MKFLTCIHFFQKEIEEQLLKEQEAEQARYSFNIVCLPVDDQRNDWKRGQHYNN